MNRDLFQSIKNKFYNYEEKLRWDMASFILSCMNEFAIRNNIDRNSRWYFYDENDTPISLVWWMDIRCLENNEYDFRLQFCGNMALCSAYSKADQECSLDSMFELIDKLYEGASVMSYHRTSEKYPIKLID